MPPKKKAVKGVSNSAEYRKADAARRKYEPGLLSGIKWLKSKQYKEYIAFQEELNKAFEAKKSAIELKRILDDMESIHEAVKTKLETAPSYLDPVGGVAYTLYNNFDNHKKKVLSKLKKEEEEKQLKEGKEQQLAAEEEDT